MERRSFLLFLAISLGAHVALLLLVHSGTGIPEGKVHPLSIYLRPGDSELSTPPASPAQAPSPGGAASSAASLRPSRRSAQPPAPPYSRPAPETPVRASSPAAETASTAGEPAPSGTDTPAESGRNPSVAQRAGSDINSAPATHGGGAGDSKIPFTGGGGSGTSPDLTKAEPAYAQNPPPRYPRPALERGWEGTVLLQVQVTPLGDVANLKVERTSGHAVLDRAALDAVRSWRFRPARLGERPVEGTVLVPVAFRLSRS